MKKFQGKENRDQNIPFLQQCQVKNKRSNVRITELSKPIPLIILEKTRQKIARHQSSSSKNITNTFDFQNKTRNTNTNTISQFEQEMPINIPKLSAAEKDKEKYQRRKKYHQEAWKKVSNKLNDKKQQLKKLQQLLKIAEDCKTSILESINYKHKLIEKIQRQQYDANKKFNQTSKRYIQLIQEVEYYKGELIKQMKEITRSCNREIRRVSQTRQN